MKNFKTMNFLIALFCLSSFDSIAQVTIHNNTPEKMHVVFLTAIPGQCQSETAPTDIIDNDGDSSPGIIDPGGWAIYPINSGHEIIWASASPRPQCCDHKSAIHNKAPGCGYQGSREGQHSACDSGCTPANGQNHFNFKVKIQNTVSLGGVLGQDIIID